jgi:polyisoprenyl-phosphate glycosyltransferase
MEISGDAIRGGRGIQILTPVFNDWSALSLLLPKLDDELVRAGMTAELLVVDDGSSEGGPERLQPIPPLRAIAAIRAVCLRRNMGHQRAIAVGLSYIDAQLAPEVVVVMDADGEDGPTDVPRMIAEVRNARGAQAVFARRQRRSEGLVFRLFYQVYRATYRLLVGHGIQFGNFSALPGSHLRRLVAHHELWNHYAAAFRKSRLPFQLVGTERQRRLDGRSSMNVVSLVTHGLSAMSVFSEVVGTRLLAATGALSCVALFGIATVVAVRIATDWAIPGWATTAAGLLGLVLLQAVTVGFLLTFVTLANRNHMAAGPCESYGGYILSARLLTGEGDRSAASAGASSGARPDGVHGLADPESKQWVDHA